MVNNWYTFIPVVFSAMSLFYLDAGRLKLGRIFGFTGLLMWAIYGYTTDQIAIMVNQGIFFLIYLHMAVKFIKKRNSYRKRNARWKAIAKKRDAEIQEIKSL